MTINELDDHAKVISGKIEDHLPDVNLGYHVIDNYNVSNLAIWFSNLTRYGTDLKPLSHVSLLEEEEYGKAMLMYGAIAGVVAIALSVLLIIFCCCNCMFRSAAPRTPKYKGKRSTGGGSFFCGVIVFVLAIAGAATFAVGIIGEVRLHRGADNVCSTVNYVDDTAHKILKETTKIQKDSNVTESLDKLDEPIKSVNDEVNKLPGGNALVDQIKKQLGEITDQYGQIKGQVNQAQTTISKQIMDTKILDEMVKHMKPVRENCPEVTKYLRVGNLLVLIVLAVSSLLFIVGLCNNCFRSIVTLVGYVMMNVLIVFGIASFLVLAAGSDFCLESKPMLRKYIKTPVLDYYLNCSAKSNLHHGVKREAPFFDINGLGQLPTIPPIDMDHIDLEQLFTQVKHFINNATEYSQMFNETLAMVQGNVEQMCKDALGQQGVKDNEQVCANIVKQVNTIKEVLIGKQDDTPAEKESSLLGKMQSVSGSVNSLIDTVDCTAISPEIDTTLSNMCTTVYEAFFFFLMNALSAVLCFYLMLLITVWMLF